MLQKQRFESMVVISFKNVGFCSDCILFFLWSYYEGIWIITTGLIFCFYFSEIKFIAFGFGCLLNMIICRPQAVMATGQVLFHRFYCKKSFARFNVKVSFLLQLLLPSKVLFIHADVCFFCVNLQRVAASCVWLASKLEESPRKARQVLVVFHRMECRRENLPIEHLDTSSKVRCLIYLRK